MYLPEYRRTKFLKIVLHNVFMLRLLAPSTGTLDTLEAHQVPHISRSKVQTIYLFVSLLFSIFICGTHRWRYFLVQFQEIHN